MLGVVVGCCIHFVLCGVYACMGLAGQAGYTYVSVTLATVNYDRRLSHSAKSSHVS